MTKILQTNSDLKNYIERISLNTQHLLNFIRKLLNYLKLRSRSVVVDEFDPAGVIEEILIKLEGEIRERNAKIIASGFKKIKCDRFLFHQILFNLIQNSLKYTHGVEQPVIEVGMKDCGNESHFYVRDNGPGLSEDEKSCIFNIYARNEDRSLKNGYGIGLAFVKRAVELQGGNVWFETEPSKGTTFFFSIPKI
jgi:signal transduction histidine kinase